MEDFAIVDLYWDRDESAIRETDRKYGRYCRKISYSILFNHEDSEECVNETWLRTWNSLPPNRPENLSTYLGKICRNISINLYEKLTAEKRGGKETELCLDELAEIVGNGSEVEEAFNASVLKDCINTFLRQYDAESRRIFVQRYWYMLSVKEIAKENRCSDSKVKMTLLRMREKLKETLIREGFEV